MAEIWHLINQGANGTLQTVVLSFLVVWVWRADKTLALLVQQLKDLQTARAKRDAEVDEKLIVIERGLRK